MKISNEKIDSTVTGNLVSIQFTNLHSSIYIFQNNLDFFLYLFTDLKLSVHELQYNNESRIKLNHNFITT